jgi:hypothetical protein
MQTLTELIVRVADLAEAEGRTLRAATVRLALGLGILIVAVGVVTAGVVLLLGAIYIVTAARFGPAAGAAVTGGIALALGGLLAWIGHRTGNR